MKLVILFCLNAFIMANYCGGNCPDNSCPTCPCGTSTSPQSIPFWCSKYGWNQACCQCVMNSESGGNSNSVDYNIATGYDVGLWKINQVNWDSCNGGNIPCDPDSNLNCAIEVYQWGGNSFRFWAISSECGCNQ